MAVGDAEAVIVGVGFTDKVTTAVAVQPAEVPDTVYCVVDAGLTETVTPLSAPGFQV